MPVDAITGSSLARVSKMFAQRTMFSTVPSEQFILDTLSTAPRIAVSTRRLRAAYTGPCLRVRRSSDNTEQDINFSGGVLDTAALSSFCGAGDGFVVTWYDQSGNGTNPTQATAANQPRIMNTGSVELLNGQPCAQWLGNQSLVSPNFTGGIPSFTTMVVAQKTNTTVAFSRFVSVVSTADAFDYETQTSVVPVLLHNSLTTIGMYRNGSDRTPRTITAGAAFVANNVVNGASYAFRINNGTDATATVSSANLGATLNLYLGAEKGGGGGMLVGRIAEAVWFHDAMSDTDRSTLNADAVTQYSIT